MKDHFPTSSEETKAAHGGVADAKSVIADLAKRAKSGFLALDKPSQIYTVALAVALLASTLFSAINVHGYTFGSMAGAGVGGLLVVVGSLAGIGITVWARVAGRRDSWIPLASAAAAAAVALVFVLAIVRSQGIGYLTALGFYLPMSAALTATTVSVQRIARA